MLYGLVPAGIAALSILAFDVGASANFAVLDRLHRLLPAVPTQIAIVALDSETVETLGWPVQKELYAAAIGALREAKAKAIGFDILFSDKEQRLEPDVMSPEQLLGVEAQRAGAVFASYLVTGGGGQLPRTPPQSSVACPAASPGEWVKPLLPGIAGKAQIGHIAADADADGTYRRIKPCKAVHDGCVADLASKLTGTVLVGASCQEAELIPFFRAFSEFPQLRLGEVIELSETPEGKARLAAFASGRVVLFGETDRSLGDFGPTPRSPSEPLVTLHANRVDALLAGVRIVSVPPPALLIISLLVLGLVLWRLERGRTLLAAAGLLTLVTLAASAIGFRVGPTWIAPAPLLVPALCGCLGAAGKEAWRYVRLNVELDLAFGKYVAPEVLAWLKATGGTALEPSAAEAREVSVLFSDIAGYTHLSNTLPAAKVMESLRFYLDEMVAIVLRHRGYVDKINGDGLVVLFGAPRNSEAHAQEAFACGRDMHRAVVNANARWKAITGTDLKIRIGVATGSAFVGNLGGAGHFEYSAIGQVVNLAARLESKSEVGGILLSAATRTTLTERPPGDWRDVELKGYESQDPVRAWQVPPEG